MTANKTVDIISRDVKDTLRLGQRIGSLLQAGDVVCLSGNLGAGKTVLTQGIGAGWGAQEPVTSPTFTLIHEHHRRQDSQTLYHVDCYRLGSAEEAWAIGLEDLLHGNDVAVLEWPENIANALPPEHLWIDMTFLDDTERHLTLRANGMRYQALLDALRTNEFDGATRPDNTAF